MNKKGVLLINLGSPDHCDKKSIARYLREFLTDPRVIDLPSYVRWPLVNGIIVPLRAKKTTAAYQQIWETGSPLINHSKHLQQALINKLGTDYQVELGMRYGKPSLYQALNKLKHLEKIIVVPLFPQYSSAATGSALEFALKQLANYWNIQELYLKKDFYNDLGFITAYAEIIKNNISNKKVDLVLFSYHGLPQRHINKSQCQANCNRLGPCPAVDDKNIFCYRAQCYATTQLLATELGLLPHQYHVSFQSRLGVTPWIKPYTDLLLPELIKKGIQDLAIVCPSFVADCLETLEEINIRARAQWHALGGNTFTFVPCLNSHDKWVNALAEMIISPSS